MADGVLNVNELQQFLSRIGQKLTIEQTKELIRKIQSQNTETITFKQFIRHYVTFVSSSQQYGMTEPSFISSLFLCLVSCTIHSMGSITTHSCLVFSQINREPLIHRPWFQSPSLLFNHRK
jgi:hypothetical protein